VELVADDLLETRVVRVLFAGSRYVCGFVV